MKFEALSFSITKQTWYIALLGLVINGKDQAGNPIPGLPRRFLWLAWDPIGFSMQLFWFIIPTGYEQKWHEHMMRRQMEMQNNFGNGKPVLTGGMKAKKSNLGMVATKGGGAKEEKPEQYPLLKPSDAIDSGNQPVTQEQPPGDPPIPE